MRDDRIAPRGEPADGQVSYTNVTPNVRIRLSFVLTSVVFLAVQGCTRTVTLRAIDGRTGAGIPNVQVVRSGIHHHILWTLTETKTSCTNSEGVIRVPLTNRPYQSAVLSKAGYQPCVVRIWRKNGRGVVYDDRAPRVPLVPVGGDMRIPMEPEQSLAPRTQP